MGGVSGLSRVFAQRTRGLALVVVAVGVIASAAGVAWVVRVAQQSQSSGRVQAGPRVLATIVSVGGVSDHAQSVRLRYADRSGTAHFVDIRFPLGLASRSYVGWTTTVAYDPASPGDAQLAGHPREQWHSVLVAGGIVAALTGMWLLWALSLFRNLGSSTGVKRRLGVAVTGIAVLMLVAGRLVVTVATASTPQLVPFPPNPPAPTTQRPTHLPAILRAPAPRSGPLITPVQARRLVDELWPLRDQAIATRNVGMLSALETGPALAVDVERIDSGAAPDRQNPGPAAPSDLKIYVPRQTRWPVRFLTEALTTAAGRRFVELMIFARHSPKSAWQVVFDTGNFQGDDLPLQLLPDSRDIQGYDVIPHLKQIDPAQVVPALAAYWQSWLDTGAPPSTGPTFDPGPWTTEYGQYLAHSQDTRDPAIGLITHVTYGAPRASPNEVWTFGVYENGELVCSPMHETTIVYGGIAEQDAQRQKWGPLLAPGLYRSLIEDDIREPCVFVGPQPVPLDPVDANKWEVGLHGPRG